MRWNTVHEKEYPQRMEKLWKQVETYQPKCRSVLSSLGEGFYELKMEYEDDEQRDAYHAITEEIRETEKLMDEKTEEMLKRLAAVRLWMWT
jgi:uncharacterized protein YhaN